MAKEDFLMKKGDIEGFINDLELYLIARADKKLINNPKIASALFSIGLAVFNYKASRV